MVWRIWGASLVLSFFFTSGFVPSCSAVVSPCWRSLRGFVALCCLLRRWLRFYLNWQVMTTVSLSLTFRQLYLVHKNICSKPLFTKFNRLSTLVAKCPLIPVLKEFAASSNLWNKHRLPLRTVDMRALGVVEKPDNAGVVTVSMVSITYSGNHYIPLHINTYHYQPWNTITLHYITLRYVTLRSITLHYITLHYVTLHYVTLRDITLHYITLHYITLHYITLHYITQHYITWHYITWHYITLHCIALHCITLHYITLHYITVQHSTARHIALHYITLHCIALHYITLHYITLHYIT